MDKNKKMNPFFRYILNNLLAIDQLINTMGGGDEDETVSSRLGKLEVKHGGKIKWKRPLSKGIAAFLNRIDKGHCKEAIEYDEGSHEVITL